MNTRRFPLPARPADSAEARLAALETRLGILPSPTAAPEPLTRVLVHAVVLSAALMVSLAILVCLLAVLW
jgi:hypothetical protein